MGWMTGKLKAFWSGSDKRPAVVIVWWEFVTDHPINMRSCCLRYQEQLEFLSLKLVLLVISFSHEVEHGNTGYFQFQILQLHINRISALSSSLFGKENLL